MVYVEYIEQQEFETGIKEVATLDEAEAFILRCYDDDERINRYLDEYGLLPTEDVNLARNSGDDDYFLDVIKRLFTTAGFYITIKEDHKDSDLDQF